MPTPGTSRSVAGQIRGALEEQCEEHHAPCSVTLAHASLYHRDIQFIKL